ncbi:MAG: RnfABCDGE type electron transport complex subunit D [Clostridia bacterium]|nr:RnfABCDGE type electron transport complex subunit D [Clostridia bacterium]
MPEGAPSFPALLTVSPSPHQKTRIHVPRMMIDVLIALLPAYVFGVVWFGLRALLVGVVSVVACIISELVFEKILRRPVTVMDGSAAVTGLLLAMNVPVTIPIPYLVIADIFAIVVVKCLFGGLGKNIVNPALAARVFLFVSFPSAMASFARPAGFLSADAVTGATPLAAIKEAGSIEGIDLLNLLLGKTGGCIGEVSAVLLLLGGLYLLCRRVISWQIPVAYLGTVALIALVFPRANGGLAMVPIELLSGGLMLGALFMATDYATSPVTSVGRLIYGVLCGLVTMFIRYFGAYPEGVSFAILIANLFVYYLDRYTKPTLFGGKKKLLGGGKKL